MCLYCLQRLQKSHISIASTISLAACGRGSIHNAKFIENGVGHIPGDRIGVGLAGNLSVSDNLIMKAFRGNTVSTGLFLRNRAVSEYSDRLIKEFAVDTPNRNTPVRNLSGGNQQKAILAREIMAQSEQTSKNNGSGCDLEVVLVTFWGPGGGGRGEPEWDPIGPPPGTPEVRKC